jgi:Tol biopolymer transport system component
MRTSRRLSVIVVTAAVLVAAAGPAVGRSTGGTRRVSVATGGAQANGMSWGGAISGDGRWVAFDSQATTLVAGDTNGQPDVFVHEMGAKSTWRVSVGLAGVQANGSSVYPSISGDGRYVVFSSSASNLVPDDTNNQDDVFVHDIWTGTTRRVSLDAAGHQLHHGSFGSAISPDGGYVAFTSRSPDVVPGDTNDLNDVFLRNLATGATRRVSVGTGGTQVSDGFGGGAPAISAYGASVVFTSTGGDVVPGDTNGVDDVFVHDVATSRTERVSVATDGTQGTNSSSTGGAPSISADGTRIAFQTYATEFAPGDTNNARDDFVRDRRTGRTLLVSESVTGGVGASYSDFPVISPDGRWVVFDSFAPDLVDGDVNGAGDVFVRDLNKGVTRLVTRGYRGPQSNGDSYALGISAKASRVVYRSEATNLVKQKDTNNTSDMFVTDFR